MRKQQRVRAVACGIGLHRQAHVVVLLAPVDLSIKRTRTRKQRRIAYWRAAMWQLLLRHAAAFGKPDAEPRSSASSRHVGPFDELIARIQPTRHQRVCRIPVCVCVCVCVCVWVCVCVCVCVCMSGVAEEGCGGVNRIAGRPLFRMRRRPNYRSTLIPQTRSYTYAVLGRLNTACVYEHRIRVYELRIRSVDLIPRRPNAQLSVHRKPVD